jgi:hypothetical protein
MVMAVPFFKKIALLKFNADFFLNQRMCCPVRNGVIGLVKS